SLDYLRSLGVDPVIDYKRERFEKKVHDVDVVLDPLGGETQARSWGVLKRGGMLITLIGEIDEKAAKHAGVRAVDFGMEYAVKDLEELEALVERGEIQPNSSEEHPLGEARQAEDLDQHGKSHG